MLLFVLKIECIHGFEMDYRISLTPQKDFIEGMSVSVVLILKLEINIRLPKRKFIKFK